MSSLYLVEEDSVLLLDVKNENTEDDRVSVFWVFYVSFLVQHAMRTFYYDKKTSHLAQAGWIFPNNDVVVM